MKTLFKLLVAALCMSSVLEIRAETKMFSYVFKKVPGNHAFDPWVVINNKIEVKAGEIVKLKSWQNQSSAYWNKYSNTDPKVVFPNGAVFDLELIGDMEGLASNFPIVGPATIELNDRYNKNITTSILLIYDLQVTEKPPAPKIPANTIVIPEDVNEPFRIIVESSEDFKNWREAETGTHGNSSKKRFFRVRAVGPVVIPADVGGPVDIVLESSSDSENWTRAEPGAYGADTPKRFFRIRSVNK